MVKSDIKKYAELLIKTGVNLQKGEMLVISAPVNAVELVRIASAQVGGNGGGGRPDMAQAGGSDASKLQQAFEEVKKAL